MTFSFGFNQKFSVFVLAYIESKKVEAVVNMDVSSFKGIGQDAAYQSLQAGVGLTLDVLTGENIGEAFENRLKTAGIQTIAAYVANQIGDAYNKTLEGKEVPVELSWGEHKLLHGALGAAIGASMSRQAGEAALAAGIAAMVAESLAECWAPKLPDAPFTSQAQKDKFQQEFCNRYKHAADMAKLTTATLAMLYCPNQIDVAVLAATNALENNFAQALVPVLVVLEGIAVIGEGTVLGASAAALLADIMIIARLTYFGIELHEATEKNKKILENVDSFKTNNPTEYKAMCQYLLNFGVRFSDSIIELNRDKISNYIDYFDSITSPDLFRDKGGKKGQISSAERSMRGSSAGGPDNEDPRKTNPPKNESVIWKKLKSFKKNIKTNGLLGKKREYYKWDHLHNDIEAFDSRGQHLGSLDPMSGEIYKGSQGHIIHW